MMLQGPFTIYQTCSVTSRARLTVMITTLLEHANSYAPDDELAADHGEQNVL